MRSFIAAWLWALLGRWVLLALILAFVAGYASAAPSCYPWDSAATNYELSTVPESKIQWLLADPARASFIATWYCDETYEWRAVGFGGWKNDLEPNWESLVVSLKNGTREERDAAWTQYASCNDANADQPECQKYLPLHPIIIAQFNATRPKPILWKIRLNGTTPTRPVFKVTNGVRATTPASGIRVETGSVANCVLLHLPETGGTYCSVEGVRNAYTATTTTPIPADHVALSAREN